MLKFFSIQFLQKEMIDSSDLSHDIDDIFAHLKKEVSENRLKKSIEKWEKDNPDNKGKLTGKDIYEELEKIVKKYYTLDFLKKR